MSILDGIKKFRVLPVPAGENPGGMETIALYGADGEPLVSGETGGAMVAGRAQYSSSQVVPSGAYTNFAWDQTQNDVLLDLTNPQEPLALADGIYTVGVRVAADTVHAGKSAYLQLDLDSEGDDCYATGDLSMDAVVFDTPVTTVTCSYFVPQGGKLVAAIQHDVGADTTFNVCMNVSFVPVTVA